LLIKQAVQITAGILPKQALIGGILVIFSKGFCRGKYAQPQDGQRPPVCRVCVNQELSGGRAAENHCESCLMRFTLLVETFVWNGEPA
jgi:hypothetical protein